MTENPSSLFVFLRETFVLSAVPYVPLHNDDAEGTMNYPDSAIPESAIPRASDPIFQHMVDTYASETNKVVSVWRFFSDADLAFKPDPKSSTVFDIMKHELLSQRRFFGEFLGAPEPPGAEVMPAEATVTAICKRFTELATARLPFIAQQAREDWLRVVPFFDVERERIWIFWRRLLHTAHHRTQLAIYCRALGKPVPSIYGPTADVTWSGADPTRSVAAAERK
jgi:uncharacterized damage-inducible protein DinB